MLLTGYSDYGGFGENLDWQLAPVLTGFYYGFMANSKTEYASMMVACVNDLISQETTEPDGYPGWPCSTARRHLKRMTWDLVLRRQHARRCRGVPPNRMMASR